MNKKWLLILLSLIVTAAIVLFVLILKYLSDRSQNDSDSDFIQKRQLRVDFIDVGKGDCILIRSENHTVMIDTGYKETADDVFDFLDSSVVSEIDALILTHYDKDHIGGAKEVLSRYQVDKIYVPDYDNDSGKYRKLIKTIDKNDIPVDFVSEKITFTADNAVFTIMPSGVTYDAKKENDNDMSLLVSVIYSKDSYLFTGDIEKPAIERFLNRNDRTYDVVKMPHHGRTEKNTKALLDSVKPTYAVITDDKENPADSELCGLLKSAGIEYYRTGEVGCVSITGNGSGIYKTETQKP